MAQLSIIIPCLAADAELAETLAHVHAGAGGLDLEIILSLPEGAKVIRTRGPFKKVAVVHGPKGRAAQLREGADAAQGDWLFFLHADTHVPLHWGRLVKVHMAQSALPAAFRLAFRARGFKARQTAAWANFRSLKGLPYGDQGLLISRRLYDAVGGYPDIALMEDVALARALKGEIVLLNGIVTTDASKYLENGWWRQGAGNLIRLIRYLRGTPAEVLARSYR